MNSTYNGFLPMLPAHQRALVTKLFEAKNSSITNHQLLERDLGLACKGDPKKLTAAKIRQVVDHYVACNEGGAKNSVRRAEDFGRMLTSEYRR